jgi:hypothetical protein
MPRLRQAADARSHPSVVPDDEGFGDLDYAVTIGVVQE